MTVQTTRPFDTEPPLSLVTAIQVTKWASEFILTCLDDPLTRRRFELVFSKCREIRWSLDDAVANPEATEADIIGFCPGQAEYLEPAVLTTDLFELSILYDRFECREMTGDVGQGKREPAAARN